MKRLIAALLAAMVMILSAGCSSQSLLLESMLNDIQQLEEKTSALTEENDRLTEEIEELRQELEDLPAYISEAIEEANDTEAPTEEPAKAEPTPEPAAEPEEEAEPELEVSQPAVKEEAAVAAAAAAAETTVTETAETSSQPEAASAETDTSQSVYISKSGKRYHINPNCSGGSYTQVTLEEALAKGLTPCKKCAGG